MPNKIVIGAGIAAVLAIIVLSKLLLAAQEEKGRISAELDEAVVANESQTELVNRLEQEKQEAQERFEAERKRADEFVVRIAEGERKLEAQKREFNQQIADVRKQLTVEELVCADERIPLAYFDGGLRPDEGSNPD